MLYPEFIGYFCITPWNNYYTSLYMLSAGDVSTTNTVEAIEPSKISNISIGMTYEQVTDTLGQIGVEVGSSTILYRYELSNSQVVFLNFSQDINNNLVLCNIIYKKRGDVIK